MKAYFLRLYRCFFRTLGISCPHDGHTVPAEILYRTSNSCINLPQCQQETNMAHGRTRYFSATDLLEKVVHSKPFKPTWVPPTPSALDSVISSMGTPPPKPLEPKASKVKSPRPPIAWLMRTGSHDQYSSEPRVHTFDDVGRIFISWS